MDETKKLILPYHADGPAHIAVGRFPEARLSSSLNEEEKKLFKRIRESLPPSATFQEVLDAEETPDHFKFRQSASQDLALISILIEQGNFDSFQGIILGGKKFLEHILLCELCKKTLAYDLGSNPPPGW